LQSKVASGEQHLSDIMELIIAYQMQVEDVDKQRIAINARRAAIADKIATLLDYRNRIETTRVDLSIVNEKAAKLQKRITQCECDIEDMKILESQIKHETDKLGYLENYLIHCAKYAELVSKSGLIFSLVDRSIPIIERFAQSLLADTTNGAISISISAYKTLSNGTRTDDVAIYMSDAKGIRDVLEASGSETVLISLALRAAMSHLLSLRTGSHVELFIVDEGMGALDDENIVVVKDMIRKLGDKFNRVLFITHVPELKDIAQSTIFVTSNSLVSTFTIEEQNEQISG
jgi:DNA repair exonuclease SbcCD ATPase subunit